MAVIENPRTSLIQELIFGVSFLSSVESCDVVEAKYHLGMAISARLVALFEGLHQVQFGGRCQRVSQCQ